MPKKTKNPRPPAEMKNLVGKLMRSTRRLSTYIGYKGPGSDYKPGWLYPEQTFVVLRVISTKHTQHPVPTIKSDTCFFYCLEILVAGTDVSTVLFNVTLTELKEVTIDDG